MAIRGGPDISENGLVLYLDAGNIKSYPGSGTTCIDLSRNGNNGTLVNGVTFSSASCGIFNFDAVDDHITVPAGFSNFTTGMTIFSFVNFGNANAWERIIEFGNGAPNNNILFSRNSTTDTLTFEVYNGTTTFGKCDVTNGILNNIIAQYAVTINGTNCVIYRNGLPLQTFSYPYLPVNITRNNNYIGRSNFGADAYFQSQIAMILVYNRALSPDEILQNFNATRSRFGI